MRRVAVGILLFATLASACGANAPSGSSDAPSRWDWPTYGHDAQHTFHGLTTLTPSSVSSLKTAWYLPTGDAVTATPTVVGGTVYVGSWDDYFYAVELRSGRLRWKTRLGAQNAVTPYPGEQPRDDTSDGGLVTSSAWYQPARGTRPALVIFGGGYTLYALDARNGSVYWRHDYPGLAGSPRPDVDGTRIFSSPVVVGDKVLFGVDVDGQKASAGYVVAASLDTGAPVWTYQTDLDSEGHLLRDGCGSVWSSPTILPRAGLAVFDVADCHFANPPPSSETVFALRVDDGSLAWVFRPQRPDALCDLDFGATANAGIDSAGNALFLGVGAKDGTYYSMDPATGRARWSTNVVFGGFSGGFIATAAYDGERVYGATSLGDFGRFEHGTTVLCDSTNPRDTADQEPSMHSFDASTGAIAWQADNSASFAPTTVAGGMTVNCVALGSPVLDVRDATTGKLLTQATLKQNCWSGVATVGDALVLGTGSTYQGSGDGIEVLTPEGLPPVEPN